MNYCCLAFFLKGGLSLLFAVKMHLGGVFAARVRPYCNAASHIWKLAHGQSPHMAVEQLGFGASLKGTMITQILIFFLLFIYLFPQSIHTLLNSSRV